jgi:hypothetical protein
MCGPNDIFSDDHSDITHFKPIRYISCFCLIERAVPVLGTGGFSHENP